MSTYLPQIHVTVPNQNSEGTPNHPPARVRVAVTVLSMLTDKTMARGMVNDHVCETIDGQLLTDAEKDLQRRACEMLEEYLDGSIKPDLWERQQLEPVQQPALPITRILGCPMCCDLPPTRSKRVCELCKGRGRLIIIDPESDHGNQS